MPSEDRLPLTMNIQLWMHSVGRDARLIVVRMEPWGGITVMQLDWKDGYIKAAELRYTFDGAIVLRAHGAVLPRAIAFPSRDTVPTMDAMVPPLRGPNSVAVPAYFNGPLLPSLLLRCFDKRDDVPVSVHHSCDREFVVGL